MKPIKLKEAIEIIVNNMYSNNKSHTFYLKDGDNNYHTVTEIDVLRDRIKCEDNYWDCFEWIIEDEETNKRLFMK